jgi:hypothetical protein
MHWGRAWLLLAKRYPMPTLPALEPETLADDRLDQILFALYKLEGRCKTCA